MPASLQPEVKHEVYPRATFRRDIAVSEEDREACHFGRLSASSERSEWDAQRVEFLSPGHPLVRAALRRTRGQVFASAFHSHVSYRKLPHFTPEGQRTGEVFVARE